VTSSATRQNPHIRTKSEPHRAADALAAGCREDVSRAEAVAGQLPWLAAGCRHALRRAGQRRPTFDRGGSVRRGRTIFTVPNRNHPQLAYVANYGDGTVTPINLATGRAGPPITVGKRPVAIAITPDGGTALVVDGGDNAVTPIRLATDRTGTPIRVGAAPVASSQTQSRSCQTAR
jgi:hypothetical protein